MDTVHNVAVAVNAYEGLKERRRRYYQKNKEFLKQQRDLKKHGIYITKQAKRTSVGVQTDR